MLGYSKNSKGYKQWNIKKNKVIITGDAIFMEDVMTFLRSSIDIVVNIEIETEGTSSGLKTNQGKVSDFSDVTHFETESQLEPELEQPDEEHVT